MLDMEFTKWYGPDGIEQHIVKQTGCKPYCGAGINIRPKENTALLKSVDNTYYYHDDLSDINIIYYTLYGPIGDQSLDEKRYNSPLMKSDNIYVFRHLTNKTYMWYGKYKIFGWFNKEHVDKNYKKRTVIVLKLKKII